MSHPGLESKTRRLPPAPQAHEDTVRICRTMEAVTAAAFSVPLEALRAPSRREAPVAFARQCAMYLAHGVLRLNYCAIGKIFHRDRTTAAHAYALVKKRRADPAIDRLLVMLEGVCRELARGHQAQPQAAPQVTPEAAPKVSS